MKPSEIKVGRTYRNKGAGKTTRKVLGIGSEHLPKFWGGYGDVPTGVGVLYEQNGKRDNMILKSFAAWCGSEVTQ